MSTDPKQARADARAEAAAAKARSKSMRPWYRKKRIIIPAVLVVVIVLISVSSSSSDDDKGDSDKSKLSHSSNQTNPPEADLTVNSCDVSEGGLVTADVQILNHSSKQSNYLVSINVLDGDGTKVGEANAVVNHVDPGQTAVDGAVGTVQGDPGAVTCKLVKVDRLAS